MQIGVQAIVGVYCILIGALIIGLWLFLLLKRLVPELKTSPGSIYLHIAVEVLTAIALLVSGLGAILTSWGSLPMMLSLGMLLYTCINSAGFYVQSRNLPMLAMFAALTALTATSIGSLFIA